MTLLKGYLLILVGIVIVIATFASIHYFFPKYKLSNVVPTLIPDAECSSRYAYEGIVNYNVPIDDAIELGNYQWSAVDPNDFPRNKKTGSHQIIFELIHFNKPMSAKEVFQEFDKRNLRPADLNELLAFGAQFQGEELMGFNIIALSATYIKWHKGCGNLRTIGISSFYYRTLSDGGGLNRYIGNCRFLAVPNDE